MSRGSMAGHRPSPPRRTRFWIAKGKQLVDLGKAVGAEAEFVSYPGRQHGFDFSDSDPMTTDAVERVTRFFRARLAA
jgi:carboxymethylenebutenolidase